MVLVGLCVVFSNISNTAQGNVTVLKAASPHDMITPHDRCIWLSAKCRMHIQARYQHAPTMIVTRKKKY